MPAKPAARTAPGMLRYLLLLALMRAGKSQLKGTEYFGCYIDDVNRDLDLYSCCWTTKRHLLRVIVYGTGTQRQ